MFLALEDKSNELNLNGFGLSITTMEEVFMRVGTDFSRNGSNIDMQAILTGKAKTENFKLKLCKYSLSLLHES